MTELASKLDTWVDQGKMVYEAIRLCQAVRKESKRTAAQDVRSRIREMQQSKDDMIRVFTLVKQLSGFIAVPFISTHITMYAAIFVQLGNLCDKVADYALEIAEETENALGPKSGLAHAIRNKTSWLNATMEISAQDKRQ